MKKVKFLIIALLCCSSFTIINADSIESNNGIENEYALTERLDSLDPSRPVLELPDGGLLQGQMEIYDGENLIAKYDSESDVNKETVSEAKTRITIEIQNGTVKNQQTSAKASWLPEKLSVLKYGSVYTSNTFSAARGWRYGGLKFIAANDSGGTYLRWSTHVDDGRVGDEVDAYHTSLGYLSGHDIYMKKNYWFDYGQTPSLYFTYNPKKGTYYKVANIDA